MGNHRARSHSGGVPAFISLMVLFDDAGVGVFVSQNAFGTPLVGEVVEEVAAHLLPAPPAAEPPAVRGDGRVSDPDLATGDWRMLRKKDTPSFTRARALLLDPPVEVAIDGDGFLTLDGQRHLEIGDLTYTAENDDGSQRTLAFTRDETGDVAFMHFDNQSARRIPWHESRWLHLALYGACLAGLLAGLALGVRRTAVARFACAVSILTLVGFLVPHIFVTFIDAGQPTYLQPLRFGMPGWIGLLLMLPRLAAIAAIGLAWIAARSRSGSKASGRERALAFVVCFAVWLLAALDLYWSIPAPGLDASY
jgi:hypothetical protein